MCGASPAAPGASLTRSAPQNGPGARRASTAGLDGSGPSAALDTGTNTSSAATPSRAARMDRVLGTSSLYARSPSSKGERTPQMRPRAAMSTADPAATILLVEDDAPTRTFLADNLTADGYDVVVAGTCEEGLRLLEQQFPDLAILDLNLPDGTGYDLIRRVREDDGVASRLDPATPLVVLSVRRDELDRVRGFDRGVDDYVCKPFSYPELRGRVAALLRRSHSRAARGRLRVGPVEIDPPSREVLLNGRRVDLSQKEYALLRLLATEPTRVSTKDELLRSVWGYRSRGTTRTLDSHACRLRHKLAADGDRFVVNVWGVGYRLVDGAVAA